MPLRLPQRLPSADRPNECVGERADGEHAAHDVARLVIKGGRGVGRAKRRDLEQPRDGDGVGRLELGQRVDARAKDGLKGGRLDLRDEVVERAILPGVGYAGAAGRQDSERGRAE